MLNGMAFSMNSRSLRTAMREKRLVFSHLLDIRHDLIPFLRLRSAFHVPRCEPTGSLGKRRQHQTVVRDVRPDHVAHIGLYARESRRNRLPGGSDQPEVQSHWKRAEHHHVDRHFRIRNLERNLLHGPIP